MTNIQVQLWTSVTATTVRWVGRAGKKELCSYYKFRKKVEKILTEIRQPCSAQNLGRIQDQLRYYFGSSVKKNLPLNYNGDGNPWLQNNISRVVTKRRGHSLGKMEDHFVSGVGDEVVLFVAFLVLSASLLLTLSFWSSRRRPNRESTGVFVWTRSLHAHVR